MKIFGAHVLLYSLDPGADREFFRDVLELRGVDAGHGWLIFALPPAEVAVHPIEGDAPRSIGDPPMLGGHLYLMCDDLKAVIATLKSKKIKYTPILKAPWGSYTTIRLPSGGHVGLYQPTHPLAIKRRSSGAKPARTPGKKRGRK